MESEMTCNATEMWSPKMPEGLDLEIAHHPLTMKRVVKLIIAMDRLKGKVSESPRSTEFTDDNLIDMLLESAVEGNHTEAYLLHHYCMKSTHWTGLNIPDRNEATESIDICKNKMLSSLGNCWKRLTDLSSDMECSSFFVTGN